MAEQRRRTAEYGLATRIGQAIMLHRGGDREEAQHRFLRLWEQLGPDGDPLERCTVAHFVADTQAERADELAWDLRALSAAEEAAARHPAGAPPAVRAFLPVLHLDLAADHAALGNSEAARRHTRSARSAAGALDDGAYGTRVRAAIGRLERELARGGGVDGTGGGAQGSPDGTDAGGGGDGGDDGWPGALW